jgi:hypothetical protein
VSDPSVVDPVPEPSGGATDPHNVPFAQSSADGLTIITSAGRTGGRPAGGEGDRPADDLAGLLDPEALDRVPRQHTGFDGSPHVTVEQYERILADYWLAERQGVRE